MEADADKENEGVKPENGESTSRKNVKLHIGQFGPSLFRPHMEVRNPMKGGLSEYYCCLCITFDVKLHAFMFKLATLRLFLH